MERRCHERGSSGGENSGDDGWKNSPKPWKNSPKPWKNSPKPWISQLLLRMDSIDVQMTEPTPLKQFVSRNASTCCFTSVPVVPQNSEDTIQHSMVAIEGAQNPMACPYFPKCMFLETSSDKISHAYRESWLRERIYQRMPT